MTIDEVIKYIASWVADKKTGSIQINMFKGGISNINLTQCIKTETKGGCDEKKESCKGMA